MAKSPVISVIMPVYNGEKYLRAAIDSVLGQTYRDYEFIIINDGSRDGTQNIIDSYQDPRIVTVVQENMGVARSLNKGLSMAKGEYIRRHDADDVSLPQHLEKQVLFMEEHPEYALISDQIAYMTDRGKRAIKYRNPRQDFFKGRPFVDVDYNTYTRYRPVIHATVLMRTRVVQELGGYRTGFLTSEDVDLWLRILDKHRIAVLNQCMYFVRLNEASITVRTRSSVNHYREMALQFAEERRSKGTDPLMRGEKIPLPDNNEMPAKKVVQPQADGRTVRDDLGFYYNITVNAKDCRNWWKTFKAILNYGWKKKQTYKMLFFPLIGKNLVELGVKVKSTIK